MIISAFRSLGTSAGIHKEGKNIKVLTHRKLTPKKDTNKASTIVIKEKKNTNFSTDLRRTQAVVHHVSTI